MLLQKIPHSGKPVTLSLKTGFTLRSLTICPLTSKKKKKSLKVDHSYVVNGQSSFVIVIFHPVLILTATIDLVLVVVF